MRQYDTSLVHNLPEMTCGARVTLPYDAKQLRDCCIHCVECQSEIREHGGQHYCIHMGFPWATKLRAVGKLALTQGF